ncbi:hypothetical protein VI08_09490 [Luteibacter yeojuensis]|uniref:Sulphotransferase Stf0 domain-containing protein n=1 Tax=Luteibacter yeojuensis TaxID=345309 RepID=A0A0F3KU60_9GAMM|nr:hypothetical protein VI08_09490 [Luteibacter yeojuensis]
MHATLQLTSIGEEYGTHQKDAWEKAFKLTGVTPVRMTYEVLLRDEEAAIAMLCERMQVTPESGRLLDIPMIERQTDGISREWRERFLEDSRTDVPA